MNTAKNTMVADTAAEQMFLGLQLGGARLRDDTRWGDPRCREGMIAGGTTGRIFRACRAALSTQPPVPVERLTPATLRPYLEDPEDAVTAAQWIGEAMEAARWQQVTVAGMLERLDEVARARAADQLFRGAVGQFPLMAPVDRQEFLQRTVEELQVLAEGPIISDLRPTTLAGALAPVVAQARGLAEIPPGLRLGLPPLDAVLGGIELGSLVTISARTSLGKSAVTQQIFENIGRTESVLLVSFEMTPQQHAQRALAQRLQVPLRAVRAGTAGPLRTDWEARTAAWAADSQAMEAGGPGLWLLCPTRRMTAGALVAQLQREYRRQPFRAVAIDYLGLLDFAVDRNQTEASAIGLATGALKQLAVGLDCVVFLVVQINREAVKNSKKRPNETGLKGSGSIEQDSDVVIILHRPDEDDAARIEVIVQKNRNGGTRVLTEEFTWRGETVTLGLANGFTGSWVATPPVAAAEPEEPQGALAEDWGNA